MNRRLQLVILILLCITSIDSYSQEKNARFNLGGGLSITENVQGIYLLGQIEYKRNVFQLRFSNGENIFETDEPNFFLNSIGENTFFYITDFSLLYGYDFLKSNRYNLVVSTGILYSFGKYRDDCSQRFNNSTICEEYNDDSFSSIGLPTKLSFVYKTKKRIGIEISGFYNFFKYDYYGGTIGVIVDISKR
ncbi:hypothetical protein [uncultured Aquimarina sp.]|uniref:hypothetical protein n=1 Tax=uncultured Aquimarina sp. TaxID=575652 RepID=UPI00262F229C|nr:hypothetical protein [uncultured Aquimarina sp.]